MKSSLNTNSELPFLDRQEFFITNQKHGFHVMIVGRTVSILTKLHHIIGCIHDNKFFYGTWDQSFRYNVTLVELIFN